MGFLQRAKSGDIRGYFPACNEIAAVLSSQHLPRVTLVVMDGGAIPSKFDETCEILFFF